MYKFIPSIDESSQRNIANKSHDAMQCSEHLSSAAGDPGDRLEADGSSIPNARREHLHHLQGLLLHLLRGLRAPGSLLGLLGADLRLPSVQER